MPDDLTLTITAGPAMPLRVAGYLMTAVAAAYPGATVQTSGDGEIRLAIPAEDYQSEAGRDRQQSLLRTLREFSGEPRPR